MLSFTSHRNFSNLSIKTNSECRCPVGSTAGFLLGRSRVHISALGPGIPKYFGVFPQPRHTNLAIVRQIMPHAFLPHLIHRILTRKISGSYLSTGTRYPKIFWWVSSGTPYKSRYSSSNYATRLPSTSYPLHYSLMNITFDAR